jgi:alkanesulfonate monooxygenase SsuD/methylene tetrahydromethanopterin reductase-like flavin-dependent oxidoreductase (luciferase family)
METKKDVFEEVRAIFDVSGWRQRASREVFRYSRCNVVPKPVQKPPHPPSGMACSQPPTIERAGQHGSSARWVSSSSAPTRRTPAHAYYNAITKRLKKLADYQINPNMALVTFFMCAKTDEEAGAP